MEKITLDHFVLLTVIGKGSYAKVVLVKKKVDSRGMWTLYYIGHQGDLRYENFKEEEHREEEAGGACPDRAERAGRNEAPFHNSNVLFVLKRAKAIFRLGILPWRGVIQPAADAEGLH